MLVFVAASVSATPKKTATPCINVPFAGNSYVTQTQNHATTNFSREAALSIDSSKGTIRYWNNPNTLISFYFKAGAAGPLKIAAIMANPQGTKSTTLEFSYNGKSKHVTVNSTNAKTYSLGTFNVPEAGYVKIDIKGLKSAPANAQYAHIESFNMSGAAVADTLNNHYIPTRLLKDCYWFRRGPSVNFYYDTPHDSIEWFYNEVVVPEGGVFPGTYFMLTGFREGYMGIQESISGRNVLFSVWSPFKTDNPKNIPDEQRVVALRKGEKVIIRDFGNEGSGGQSFLDFNWKAGATYKTLVHVVPDGKGNTVYTGYFCDENGTWHLMASFRRPATHTYYRGAHSFLECFIPETSFKPRAVEFCNPWARLANGTWVEITTSHFNCDHTGALGVRADMSGALENNNFVLRNCGFTNEHTKPGTIFTRKASGNVPSIDFDMLEKLK